MTLNFPPAPVAFFALNNRSGSPQLRVYAGGERLALGTTFASAETPEAGDQGTSRVLLFGAGNNTLVAMQATGIYRTTDLGNNWTLVHTLTSADASACKSGLFVVYLNGIATLCGFYRGTSGNFRGVTSTDGISWTNVALSGATTIGTDEAPYSCIVYRNKICCLQASQNIVLIYDPGSGVITSIPNASIPSSSGVYSAGLTVCNGNLYIAYRDTSGFLCLAKMNAGTFTNKFTSTASVNFGSSSKWGVWTFTASNELAFNGFNPASIDEEINVLAHRTAGGWGAYQFKYNSTLDTFTFFDFTSLAIPALMTSAGTSSSVALYLDSNTNPGYVRDMFVFFKDGGSNWNMYRWNAYQRMGKWSDLAANVPLGVFTDNNDALPSATNVNGSYSAALLRPEIVSQAYVTGGIRFTFILNTPAFEGQLVKVIGFWGTQYLTLPNGLIATLSDTSHGVITGGVIYNLTADASTQYQVTWLAEADGFSNFDPYKFILTAFAQ